MTETAPVPPHLLKGLSTRARNILIRMKVESHQDLIDLAECGLPKKFKGCGIKTVAELKRLLEQIWLEHVQLLSSAELSERDEGTAIPWDDTEASAAPADAACPKWSILNRTFAELCTDAASLSQCAWPETIKLPPADLVRLRAVGVFPEDTPYLLCSFTIDYLLEAGLSDAALSAMLHAAVRGTQLPGGVFSALAVVPADVSLYPDFPEGLLDPLIVPDFPFPQLLGFVDAPTDAVAWSVVAKITERSVIKQLGFTVTALRAIKYLWGLKVRAQSVAKSAAAGVPTDSYLDFDQLLDRYLQVTRKGADQNPASPKRSALEHSLAREHLGPKGHKVSLRELGNNFGVSGERVRQVEVKLLRRLNEDANLKLLDYLWRLLDLLMISGGGARYANELCLSLQAMHGWNSPPSEKTLAVLMRLSPRYRVAPESSPIRMALTGPCCVSCETASGALSGALTASEASTAFSCHRALDVMRDTCVKMQCPELRKATSFSLSVIEFMAELSPVLRVHDQEIDLEVPRHRCTGREKLEEVLLSAPEGMHFNEVYRSLKLLHPETTSTARWLHYRLKEARWAVPWGFGSYKHRALLTIPGSLISEIIEDFAAALDAYDLPYLCVNGHHFDRYADRLRSEGIPTSRALYSCMKIAGSPTMSFEKFPYVLRKGLLGPRPAIPILLEQFIAKAHRAVSYQKLKDFGTGRLGIPILQMQTHLKQTHNILMIRGLLLHVDHIPIITDQLHSIVEALSSDQGKPETTEAALFRKHQDACKSIGITAPKDLFCFVEHFLPGTIKWHMRPDRKYLPWKHAAVKDKGDHDAPKPAPVNAEPPTDRTAEPPVEWVYAYLEDLGKPCLTKHLFAAFRAEPQHNSLYKRWIGNTEMVLWYTRESVIARRVLDWNDEKQYTIEALAMMYLEQAGGRNKPYGSCREILRDFSEQLPELAVGFPWTPILLHGLLVSGNNFVHIGRQKDLFISVDNAQGSRTLNDLLYHVLLTEHRGYAPKKEFISACEKEGISLRPSASFLTGKDPRVVIDGDVIRAAAREAGV